MSGSTEKATRRDLRRTLGQSGLGVVNQHADALTSHKRVIDQHSHQLESLMSASMRHERAQIQADRTVARFLTLPFWGRLRWLLLGA